jgi:hypothetical protein
MVVLTAVGLMVALVVAVVYGSAISAADLS